MTGGSGVCVAHSEDELAQDVAGKGNGKGSNDVHHRVGLVEVLWWDHTWHYCLLLLPSAGVGALPQWILLNNNNNKHKPIKNIQWAHTVASIEKDKSRMWLEARNIVNLTSITILPQHSQPWPPRIFLLHVWLLHEFVDELCLLEQMKRAKSSTEPSY